MESIVDNLSKNEFTKWYVMVLKKYTQFDGRARRKEYWMFFLVNVIVSIIVNVIDSALRIEILALVYALAVFVPSLAVGARRLHDTNKTGWWLLLGLIPVIGWIILIIFFITEGNKGDNEYGSDPKQSDLPTQESPVPPVNPVPPASSVN